MKTLPLNVDDVAGTQAVNSFHQKGINVSRNANLKVVVDEAIRTIFDS